MFYASLKKFSEVHSVCQIVLVLPEEYLEEYSYLLKEFSKLKLVCGGKDRIHSVRFGVEALNLEIKQVMIHDVARPLFSNDLIQNCLVGLEKYSAFVTGVLSSDTVKVVNQNKVEQTLQRDKILLVQTPQCFHLSLLQKCYQNLDSKKIQTNQFTDEASLLEFFGEQVFWVQGSHLNRKITYQEDLKWLEKQ